MNNIHFIPFAPPPFGHEGRTRGKTEIAGKKDENEKNGLLSREYGNIARKTGRNAP
jgi:hypothetical protein